MIWASGRCTLSLHSIEKKIQLQNFFLINKIFNILYASPDKLNGCGPSLILVKESYSLQNFRSFDWSHLMLLSKSSFFFVKTLLVAIVAMSQCHVLKEKSPFWAAAPMGQCPVGHSGELLDVLRRI